jgi:hypothetical protein
MVFGLLQVSKFEPGSKTHRARYYTHKLSTLLNVCVVTILFFQPKQYFRSVLRGFLDCIQVFLGIATVATYEFFVTDGRTNVHKRAVYTSAILWLVWQMNVREFVLFVFQY